MTSSIIKERLDLLETNYRNYLVSGEVSKIAQDFATEHQFNEDKSIVFENGIVMLLMFFIDKKDFVDYLVNECGINSIHDAEILTEAILLSLPKNTRSSYDATRIQIFENLSGLEKTLKPEEPINIDKEIKETEAVLNSMNHIRTMSGDREVAKEAVHVSSQFDLFGLRSKKTEEKDNSVKWETDK